MYHVTAESQGLSRELMVAAQERQKLFLQVLEERLIAPPPPAASRRHTGHRRKGTASASTSEENSPISIPNPIGRYKRRLPLAPPWGAQDGPRRCAGRSAPRRPKTGHASSRCSQHRFAARRRADPPAAGAGQSLLPPPPSPITALPEGEGERAGVP